MCGATNLGEALRRITEGAAMIRSKGEAGTGDVSEATKHIRTIKRQIAELQGLYNTMPDELYVKAKELAAPYELVREVAQTGKLPVVMFTAGGVATPADAAMMMQLGADGVFVGSGIFKSGDPVARAKAIVRLLLSTMTRRRLLRLLAAWVRLWSALTLLTFRHRTAWRSAAGNSCAHPAFGVSVDGGGGVR